jgi:hypothetical protein
LKLANVDRVREGYSRAERLPKWSMHPVERGIVGELGDCGSDATPYSGTRRGTALSVALPTVFEAGKAKA